MEYEIRAPQEGDLYSVVTIEDHIFEMRYGYYEDYERGGDPVVLYPDLETKPLYTKDGQRIVTAIQSICRNYLIPEGRTKEDCCYTCEHYSDPKDDVSICRCEKMRLKSKAEIIKSNTGGKQI